MMATNGGAPRLGRREMPQARNRSAKNVSSYYSYYFYMPSAARSLEGHQQIAAYADMGKHYANWRCFS
jgi:hypothetical protein